MRLWIQVNRDAQDPRSRSIMLYRLSEGFAYFLLLGFADAIRKTFALPNGRITVDFAAENVGPLITPGAIDVMDFYSRVAFLQQLKAEAFKCVWVEFLEALIK